MADQPCGFLVLDKPAGLSSHDCVSRVRRAYGLRRVGHGGTLDPSVTGVLPIALGSATRLLPYLGGSKTYRGTVQLGLSTSSDDLQGQVLARHPVPALEASGISAALSRFRGLIDQVPPQVSAVHVDGQRAYQRVRRGETPSLAARPVLIERLELLGWQPAAGRLKLEVTCSAGTYIRSLARDLGAALGCGGALASLQRTAALGFLLEQAVPLEALQRQPPPALLEPLAALTHLPLQRLSCDQLAGWRCGRQLAATPPLGAALAVGQAVVVVTPDGNLAGMARATAAGLLQPKLVLEAAG
ncbi:MAG: tRNA pseudouridine(55) synthase TruB [Cyanobacteria bacterium J06638_7]